MSAKNRVTINLDDDEYAALQMIAERTDRSLSWLGRKAVSDFVHNERAAINRALTPQREEMLAEGSRA